MQTAKCVPLSNNAQLLFLQSVLPIRSCATPHNHPRTRNTGHDSPLALHFVRTHWSTPHDKYRCRTWHQTDSQNQSHRHPSTTCICTASHVHIGDEAKQICKSALHNKLLTLCKVEALAELTTSALLFLLKRISKRRLATSPTPANNTKQPCAPSARVERMRHVCILSVLLSNTYSAAGPAFHPLEVLSHCSL